MTEFTRRHLLTGAVAGGAALAAVAGARGQTAGDGGTGAAAPTRPARLREGDLVALVAPASVTYDEDTLLVAVESLEALGLRVRVGEHVMERYGYLAGRDEDRAADINAAFADGEVRGGDCPAGRLGRVPGAALDRLRPDRREPQGGAGLQRHHLAAAGAAGALEPGGFPRAECHLAVERVHHPGNAPGRL